MSELYSHFAPGAASSGCAIASAAMCCVPVTNSTWLVSDASIGSPTSVWRSPDDMVSRCRSVIAARRSPGRCHSAIGAGSSTFSLPSATSAPTSTAVTVLFIDQLMNRLPSKKPGA